MKYTDETVAECLAQHAAGTSISAIGRSRGIPESTIRHWVKKRTRPVPAELAEQKRVDLAQAIRNELVDILGEMPHKREHADYKTLAVALGILTEKYQLLTGGATENVAVDQRVIVFKWGDDD